MPDRIKYSNYYVKGLYTKSVSTRLFSQKDIKKSVKTEKSLLFLVF